MLLSVMPASQNHVPMSKGESVCQKIHKEIGEDVYEQDGMHCIQAACGFLQSFDIVKSAQFHRLSIFIHLFIHLFI